MGRCKWAENEIFHEYHDNEWGKPVHNDRVHFEFLILEAAQAGLSWATILKRREGYKKAFANFDVKKVSKFDKNIIDKLMLDEGIIRNRSKIESAINNAKLFMEVQKEFGSFDKYVWGFVNGKPIVGGWKEMSQIPAKSKEAETLSKDLKRRGFKFVGPTIMYAYMQAVGLVNDHQVTCFCYKH